MNTGSLKTYAVQARKNFIQAVTDRAAQLGITKASIAPAQASSGSGTGLVVIAGVPFPASVVHARDLVVTAIARDGFRPVIEQVAYTWFNRLVALRYMEIHGYLDHGLRVLSDPNGGAVPEAVARLRDLDLPTLDKPKAVELAMAGNQDEALYRLILLAQCRHLSKPMPWLFDTRLHDGVDLLLPEHLLATDSLVRSLVNDIPEEDWKQGVEIIGWLYQFFISERKDEVIGSVVAPEDIPAATQLFTPNWIVQYLVQNSIGRLWMESYPESTLRQHMPYYIEPATQDSDVQVELDKLVVRDRNPESLTVLDPACGSGHILVEAFRLLFKIYLERGHREREIPRLISAHNLFGLDIDDRAAQLACMTLLFEARRHDARIFTDPPQLQIMALQQSLESDRAVIDGSGFAAKAEAKELVHLFRDAKTFGSLLRMPKNFEKSLVKIQAALPKFQLQQSFLSQGLSEIIHPLLTQGQILGRQYEAIVANPPYIGGKGMTKVLKEFAKEEYPRSKADTFSMFIEHGIEMASKNGLCALVTMHSWMFLSSFEEMRIELLKNRQISTLAHLGARALGSISGEIVKTCAFVIRPVYVEKHRPVFIRLLDGEEHDKSDLLKSNKGRIATICQSDLADIPGMPVAYWVDKRTISIFKETPPISEMAKGKSGQNTGDNDRFTRFWHEINFDKIGFGTSSLDNTNKAYPKWYPYNKGGRYRRWYGNFDTVINWSFNGREIKDYATQRNGGKHWSRYIQNLDVMLKEGITWSFVSSTHLGARYTPIGHLFDYAGCSIFPNPIYPVLAILNSRAAEWFIKAVNPTMNLQPGTIGSIPLPTNLPNEIAQLSEEAVELAKHDCGLSHFPNLVTQLAPAHRA